MKPRRGSIRRASFPVAVALTVALASPAQAAKYCVNRHEDQYHYGNSASILVNPSVRFEDQKVASLVLHRTDWGAIAEIGHYWIGNTKSGFYVWGEYGAYNERDLPDVSAGSTHRYWVGWHPTNKYHYFWMDDVSTPKASQYLQSMTSSWSCLNVERDGTAGGSENLACFTNLKYRSPTWGVWYDRNGRAWCADSDPYYYLKDITSTHIDGVHN